ncbi:N-acetylmuramoyl-L-alanine amidase CwlD [Sporolactobacillus kofuensis]|uniref:N-acetylmuramoyl-L-alanine amidase CwlD n=1 Tax=Sporolactobacillus kofuensis TaxID=269672 RepID=A0ABW1WID9_9BACL|nr:N-acetylmuramoyl-L-alanine amidase CwlD [Sporolactobacillus kofuensis]MCO7176771.1 N-acetylmuramoyl-L-alanine amidase CwlD [Sporolactobacillus kofuensis]
MKRRWLFMGCMIVVLSFVTLAGVKWLVSWHASERWHMPLAGRVIVIDAGHGGPDGGAVGGDTEEKDINLKIAKDLRNYLQESGALVVMTRETDADLSDENYRGRHKRQDLIRRAELINKTHPDAFVSVHMNAIPMPSLHGAQTFYHPKFDENRKLALFIQDSLKRNLGNTTRFAKPISHVYLLKKAEAPSALVEVGFLSNAQERALLEQSTYQKQAAASISQGIMRYFTNEKIPSD